MELETNEERRIHRPRRSGAERRARTHTRPQADRCQKLNRMANDPGGLDFSSQLEVVQARLSKMTELMTIGYEGMALKEFLDVLKRCRVSTLVDVRELPISRKPGFAKAALSAALEESGIKYEHLVDLGCPRDVRHEYREDGDWSRYTRKYKAYLETQEDALDHLWNLMKGDRCCLMCFEADFNFCHRSFIAERMVARADGSMRALHLTGPMTGRVVARGTETVLAGK